MVKLTILLVCRDYCVSIIIPLCEETNCELRRDDGARRGGTRLYQLSNHVVLFSIASLMKDKIITGN